MIGSVFAVAAAKNAELFQQQDSWFYPAQWRDVLIANITFNVDLQILGLNFAKIIARAITAKENELLRSASEASCCFETYAVSPDPFKEFPDAEEPFAYQEKSFFRSDESKFKYLDERMNDVYKAVHFLLSPAQFKKVKQDQIAWLKQRDATKAVAGKSELTEQRIKALQQLAWPGKKEDKEQ